MTSTNQAWAWYIYLYQSTQKPPAFLVTCLSLQNISQESFPGVMVSRTKKGTPLPWIGCHKHIILSVQSGYPTEFCHPHRVMASFAGKTWTRLFSVEKMLDPTDDTEAGVYGSWFPCTTRWTWFSYLSPDLLEKSAFYLLGSQLLREKTGWMPNNHDMQGCRYKGKKRCSPFLYE